MNHGRHCAAGASGKAEEFNELNLSGGKIDRCGIGRFEFRAA
jgi:hypothetical protein